MKFAIVVSNVDPAGLNVKSCLLDNYEFTKCNDFPDGFEGNDVFVLGDVSIYTVNERSVYNEGIDAKIKTDLIVFATTHRSVSGKKSLSVHVAGNWSVAELGGQDRVLSVASSFYLKNAYINLQKNNTLDDFEVIQECTHHGPALSTPSFFIEIGSSENEWSIRAAGEIIAKTIMETIGSKPDAVVSAVGIGGLHHCPNFAKIMLNTDICLSHVCPKYNLENLDADLILQAMNKSVPKANMIILDWKGLKDSKERVKLSVDEVLRLNPGVVVKRTSDF